MKKIIIDKDSKLPIGKFVSCYRCPCLKKISDYCNNYCKCDFGSDFYIGWPIKWNKPNPLIISGNCNLIHIRYTNDKGLSHKLFIPEQIKLVMK